MNESEVAAAVINRHFRDGETTCRHLTKPLPDNSSTFAAEATSSTLTLNYYQYMGSVHHGVVVYSDSMTCLRSIGGVINIIQLTHWTLSSREFLRFALWNSWEKRYSSTWYERSDISYNPSLDQSLNWCNVFSLSERSRFFIWYELPYIQYNLLCKFNSASTQLQRIPTN